MKATLYMSLMVTCVVGTVACGDDDDSSTRDTAASETIAPTTTAATATTVAATDPPAGDVLFSDTFDDDRNLWGEVDGEFGTAKFEGGDYVWAFTGSVSHWLPGVIGEQYDSGELEMLDVTVQADVTIDGGDGVVGVFCRETPDTDAEWQWYEFVARDGYAAIRVGDLEANLDVLAETDDVTLPPGEPFSIAGSCVNDADGNTQLTMSINDEQVLDASHDDPLDNGVVGLQVYTFPIHEQMDVRWHDFSVTTAS